MSEIHDEQTLKDKPDCGVIDPAWCEADDEGQLFSIPCKIMLLYVLLMILNWKFLIFKKFLTDKLNSFA